MAFCTFSSIIGPRMDQKGETIWLRERRQSADRTNRASVKH